MHVMILNIYTLSNKEKNAVGAIVLTLSVDSVEQLRTVADRIRKIRGVTGISRG